jgi:hypothetical protein
VLDNHNWKANAIAKDKGRGRTQLLFIHFNVTAR